MRLAVFVPGMMHAVSIQTERLHRECQSGKSKYSTLIVPSPSSNVIEGRICKLTLPARPKADDLAEGRVTSPPTICRIHPEVNTKSPEPHH